MKNKKINGIYYTYVSEFDNQEDCRMRIQYLNTNDEVINKYIDAMGSVSIDDHIPFKYLAITPVI